MTATARQRKRSRNMLVIGGNGAGTEPAYAEAVGDEATSAQPTLAEAQPARELPVEEVWIEGVRGGY
jgi:hypothetical protein